MKRMMSFAAVLLAAVLAMPGMVAAAGLPGATVQVTNQDGLPGEVPPVVTDAEGAFEFASLPAGSWLLEVTTADLSGKTQIFFAVPAEGAPSLVSGRVTAIDGAALSLQVSAVIGAPWTEVFPPPPPVEPPVEPPLPAPAVALPPVWNFNWARSQGKINVFLAGDGLESPAKVTLTSEAGSIETTYLVLDPFSGVLRARFPKGAAFRALVPEDALRGDTVAVKVELTTALGTTSVDTTIRLVGPKKRVPFGRTGPKFKYGHGNGHGRKR